MADTLSVNPCNVCPRLCKARRMEGERGVCGASGELLVARAALHFWEEPPLSGESGSGAVFFSHCPLHCVYCQNFEIAAGNAGQAVSCERLSTMCLELQGQGALNVNFVTPTHYMLDIMEAVKQAREQGLSIPVVWNTSGYERVEAVRALSETVDVWLVDYKYADPSLAQRYSHARDYPAVALEAIESMLDVAGKPVFDEVGGRPRMTAGIIVRHLVLPGALEQSKHALRVLFDCFGNDVLYSIMNQYTPVLPEAMRARFPELGRRVPDDEYDDLLDYADGLGMEDYFWQQGPAAEESFIPSWDGTGV